MAALGLLLLGHFANAQSAEVQPRSVSPVEREAVRLAVAYCRDGADAWWPELTEDAPLRAIGREAMKAELEVRAGRACEASWELQTVGPEAADRFAVFALEFPSGLEDALILELANHDHAYRLRSVRALSEPAPEEATVPAAVGAGSDLPPSIGSLPELAGVMALAAIGVLMASWRESRSMLAAPPRLALSIGLSLLVLVAPSILSCGGRGPADSTDAGTPEDSAAGEGANFLRLASLADLRQQVTTRTEGQLDDVASALAPESPELQSVASLWRAQRALLLGDVKEATGIVGSAANLDRVPLAQVLRGRLAFLESEEVEAALGYELALALVPRYDGLLLEAMEVAGLLGFEDRSDRYLEALGELGTRDGEVYYMLARRALIDRHPDRADALSKMALYLQPRPKSAVLDDAVLAHLVEPGSELFRLLHLDRPEDTIFRHPETSKRPLELGPGVRARLMGGLLLFEIGGGKVFVPGGAELAPPGTPVESPEAWRREEAAEVLGELGELIEESARPGALAQGALRRRLEVAATALSEHSRWNDLVELTEPLAGQVANADAGVLRLRARALQQLGRTGDASHLLASVALHAKTSSRFDPLTLFQLSDLLAMQGQYEAAIRLATRANAQLPTPVAEVQIQRLQMERDLAADFETTSSEHFNIRHPRGREELAHRMSRVLEAERERLQRFIPLRGSKSQFEVHLMSFGDFARRYAGGVEVIGIFDGRIRLPLADVPYFPPIVVQLMTHELAHAMIAEATHNQAPKWLHEGLAQHVEMVAAHVNPIADFMDRGQFLSFPAVEASLRSFPNVRLVATAYDEAAWIVHYVESEHGARAIHRLLDAYRDGSTTEDALAQVFGMSVGQFDAALRHWWLGDAPLAWSTEVHEYERGLGDRLVRRADDFDPDFLQTKWWQEQ